MKIISKYYDFYDSCGPYDETEPVYVRTPEYFSSEKYTLRSDRNLENHFPEFTKLIHELFYNRDSRRIWMYPWALPLIPPVFYVGIFPKIWAVPLTCRKLDRFESYKGPQDIVSYIPKNEKEVKLFEEPKECQEIFYGLAAPTFAYAPTQILLDKKHLTVLGNPEAVSLIVNPVFQNLTPGIIDKIEVNPLKIYNDIENFLWSLKQEKISEPSNNTKILSAGFDLKTSFRNVK